MEIYKCYKSGDRIRILEKPSFWSSGAGGGHCPFDLEYPRDFVIREICNRGDHIAMRTEDEYGFTIDKLVEEGIIKKLTSGRSMPVFKVGDKVKYVSGNHGDCSSNPLWGGSRGKVIGTVDELRKEGEGYPYDVKWDNGFHNDYLLEDLEKLIPSGEEINQKAKTMLNELTNALKRLFDNDQQALYKAGYIDREGQATDEGREELEAISLEANKEKLVELANAKIAEAKK